ncbi:hypothetical protein [Methylobacterium sp.]|uniref:hypothetical protein n=1 Tax=Methylobacterium sp. TaxID=409 RepID=UPI0025D174DE|nr:hypothetical protein [Methylobacterium sp.]
MDQIGHRNAVSSVSLLLHSTKEAIMKAILASSLLALGLLAAAPASAQRLEIGPDGPAVDMRSRDGRDRDYDRREIRRDMERGEMRRDRREMQRSDDDDDDED